MNKEDIFLKKLWCCVGRGYLKIYWFNLSTGLITQIGQHEDIVQLTFQ